MARVGNANGELIQEDTRANEVAVVVNARWVGAHSFGGDLAFAEEPAGAKDGLPEVQAI